MSVAFAANMANVQSRSVVIGLNVESSLEAQGIIGCDRNSMLVGTQVHAR
jgi:hypothetical protein